MDEIEGHLEVGANDRGEVVINLDHDRTGHIVFSPMQARTLATLLYRQASEAEGLKPLQPLTGDGVMATLIANVYLWSTDAFNSFFDEPYFEPEDGRHRMVEAGILRLLLAGEGEDIPWAELRDTEGNEFHAKVSDLYLSEAAVLTEKSLPWSAGRGS